MGRDNQKVAAGIVTHCFVIGVSRMFIYISALVDPNSTSRLAAQIMTRKGFLGDGIIPKGELFDNKDSDNPLNRKVLNLTAAASIWFSGAIGMATGFNFYFFAIVSVAFAVIVTRISQVGKRREKAVE